MTHAFEKDMDKLDRRHVLAGAAGLALLPVPLSAARATPETMAAAVQDMTGGAAKITPGRVAVEAPRLAENGNSVQIIIKADSPMTPTDHVKTITVFSEKNPIATVARFHFGPRAGVAKVATSIRLAATQRVLAIATMSDGSHWSGETEVIVTLAACLDGG
jgi:sulfur-oxidizing protein SoxY